jgi:quinoprotein dehydrogenase-associated probable ABC transporter substrate-binding protein
MSFSCLDRWALACVLAFGAMAAQAQAQDAAPLRVCADPDNLPYSNADGRGFEVRIAQLLADELKQPLEMHWQPLRRGFVRKTLGEGVCDVLMGVPVGMERVLTTRAYYRSSYVFAARAQGDAPLAGFDDPRLQKLRIGVQLIGNDLAASPPGYALARHGAVDRVVGYTVDGGEGPAGERMVQALQAGQLDAALVWGPQVGWFAQHASVPIALAVARAPEDVKLPFEFSIAVGVRKGDTALRDRLQAALDARREQVDAVLAEYAVPRTDRAAAVAGVTR